MKTRSNLVTLRSVTKEGLKQGWAGWEDEHDPFYEAGFQRASVPDRGGLEVERLTWRAVGGPWEGRLRATGGSMERLWSLVDLLRCGVKICDSLGAAWWGYVESVALHLEGQVARLSMKEVWNRVAVKYTLPSPAETGGEEMITGWAENAASIRTYGTKEKIFEMGQGSLADAEARRDVLLAWHAYPRLEHLSPSGEGSGENYAEIELAGWWKTLDWEYYSQARGQAGNLHGGASLTFGTSGVQRVSQAFVSESGSWAVSEVWVRVKRYLAADNLRVSIYSSSAGVPDVELAYAVIGPGSLEDELTWVQCGLNTTVTVDESTVRHVVLSRSGSLSGADYFVTAVDEGLLYGGGMLVDNGSSWGAPAPLADLTFLVLGVEDTGVQAQDMVKAGQFITGARLEAGSGIYGRLYRDGERRIRDELEDQLRTGLDNGRAFLGLVDSRRVANLYARPVAGRPWLRIGSSGELLRASGRRVAPSELPAGQWAGMGEAATFAHMLGYAGAVWIEGCRWEAGRLRILGASPLSGLIQDISSF